MNKIKLTQLILLQAVLFAIFLVATSWFNRFVADDYYFIGEMNTKSFKEIYEHLYFKWHGRWSSNFFLLLFLELRNIPYFLFMYFLFSYSLLFVGVKRFVRELFAEHHLHLKNKQLTLFSIIAIGVLFFCTINPNETWFWYTSSVVYFWSVIAFFFAAASYFKIKKNAFDYFIYSIALLYIGGSNEPLTFFLIIAFFVMFIKKLRITFNIIGLALLTSAFLANYLSSGTLHRDEITPGLGIIDLILYTGYGSLKYLFINIYRTFIPALFFAIPFYWLGKNTAFKSSSFKPFKQLMYSVLGICLIVIANQFIVIYALGGLSPDRACTASSIGIALLIIRFLFLLGVFYQNKTFVIKPILYINVIALFIFNLIFIKIHYNFSNASDNRIEKILKSSSNNEVIYLEPLPYSGYLYNSELSNDADFFINQHLKNGLGVNSNLKLKTD
jgi:hypothetical protein